MRCGEITLLFCSPAHSQISRMYCGGKWRKMDGGVKNLCSGNPGQTYVIASGKEKDLKDAVSAAVAGASTLVLSIALNPLLRYSTMCSIRWATLAPLGRSNYFAAMAKHLIDRQDSMARTVGAYLGSLEAAAREIAQAIADLWGLASLCMQSTGESYVRAAFRQILVIYGGRERSLPNFLFSSIGFCDLAVASYVTDSYRIL